jgi:H+/gluconate symporter-like permease
MITTIILATLAGVILAHFAWVGIGHYKTFSEDDDKEKTSFILRFFISLVLLVLLCSNAIIAYNAFTKDHTNNNVLESEEKR